MMFKIISHQHSHAQFPPARDTTSTNLTFFTEQPILRMQRSLANNNPSLLDLGKIFSYPPTDSHAPQPRDEGSLQTLDPLINGEDFFRLFNMFVNSKCFPSPPTESLALPTQFRLAVIAAVQTLVQNFGDIAKTEMQTNNISFRTVILRNPSLGFYFKNLGSTIFSRYLILSLIRSVNKRLKSFLTKEFLKRSTSKQLTKNEKRFIKWVTRVATGAAVATVFAPVEITRIHRTMPILHTLKHLDRGLANAILRDIVFAIVVEFAHTSKNIVHLFGTAFWGGFISQFPDLRANTIRSTKIGTPRSFALLPRIRTLRTNIIRIIPALRRLAPPQYRHINLAQLLFNRRNIFRHLNLSLVRGLSIGIGITTAFSLAPVIIRVTEPILYAFDIVPFAPCLFGTDPLPTDLSEENIAEAPLDGAGWLPFRRSSPSLVKPQIQRLRAYMNRSADFDPDSMTTWTPDDYPVFPRGALRPVNLFSRLKSALEACANFDPDSMTCWTLDDYPVLPLEKLTAPKDTADSAAITPRALTPLQVETRQTLSSARPPIQSSINLAKLPSVASTVAKFMRKL
jgi:hypothetical protein